VCCTCIAGGLCCGPAAGGSEASLGSIYPGGAGAACINDESYSMTGAGDDLRDLSASENDSGQVAHTDRVPLLPEWCSVLAE